jgi:peptidoglycan/xylan/chitin deacetylase (PgdA/CDA1 family)
MARFAVTPDELARHLDLIVSHGCTALTVSGLVDLLDRDVAPPPATVVITFDDGYEDNLTVAAPLLVDRGLPATVFAATGFLPGCPGVWITRPPGPMLPWDLLPELEAAGIEVGSHSHSHPELDVLSRADAAREIRHSKDVLEDILGHAVHSFAYPHGYASRWLRQEVRDAGFRSACGVRNAFSHALDDRWMLSRLTVGAPTTCDQFEAYLQGVSAPMAGARELARTAAWRAARRAQHQFRPVPRWTGGVVACRATPR